MARSGSTSNKSKSSKSSSKSKHKRKKNEKPTLAQQKDEARVAAQEAAKRAVKLLYEGHHATDEFTGRHQDFTFKLANHMKPLQCPWEQEFRLGMPSSGQYYGDAADAGSVASEMSSERAVRRGSSRGTDERNERPSLANGHYHSTGDPYELASIAENGTTVSGYSNKKKKRRRIFRKKTKKSSVSGSSQSSSLFGTNDSYWSGETVQGAWICGCCGKAFSSLKAAESHEDECILDAINRLELMPDSPTFLKTPAAVATPAAWPSSAPMTPAEIEAASFFPSSRNSLIVPNNAESFNDDFHSVHSDEDQNQSSTDLSSARLLHGASQQEQAVNRRTSSSKFGAGTRNGDDFLLSPSVARNIVLTDEALVNTVYRAQTLVITYDEIESERALSLLAADKQYYDMMLQREVERDALKGIRFRTNRKGVLSRVQNKFAEAYELIKEGDERSEFQDQYSRKDKGKGDKDMGDITHDDKTLYVNVIVKNSARVVENELHRLAKVRWEQEEEKKEGNDEDDRFEKFRAIAQSGVVRLAGMALQSDFTPRRIAVQLSNDLYRLMAPHLKRRGVEIETEIEYRVGAFFVLAVNIKKIDWIKLIRLTYREVTRRKRLWRLQQMQQEEKRLGERRKSVSQTQSSDEAAAEDSNSQEVGMLRTWLRKMYRLSQMTKFEVIAQCLAWLYHVHWLVSVPLCSILYLLIPSTMRKYILTTVTDEIFSYVEQKGMEMEIKVEVAQLQASFMLSALRELRADDRTLKQKRLEGEEGAEGVILGPLLGPAIKVDKGPPSPPADFEPPENLEMVGLEIDLPVGFRRLRWALLHHSSSFVTEAVWKHEAKYENIHKGEWSHHNEEIGLPELPAGVTGEDLVGAEVESDYLMPKSAFVKANTAFETAMITVYNDHCFCLKKRTRTPDVPYGGTFIAWTQYIVTNTGNDTCHLVCSTEAEFPNGPPMVSRQIKSGMRAGTAELFVLMGELICKYEDEYP